MSITQYKVFKVLDLFVQQKLDVWHARQRHTGNLNLKNWMTPDVPHCLSCIKYFIVCIFIFFRTKCCHRLLILEIFIKAVQAANEVSPLINMVISVMGVFVLTFTVLAARAARGVAVAGELVVRRRLAGVRMGGVRLIGEGVHHGPGGGARERQGGQGVLV